MAQRLNKRASGTRHLQWTRAIRATILAHLEINDTLSEAQREALEQELNVLNQKLAALEEASNGYQTFLRSAYTQIRAKQRVADFLCDEAMTEAQARLKPRKNDINDVIPGGYARLFSGLTLSRALRAGTEATAAITLSASLLIESLPVHITGSNGLALRLKTVSDLLTGFNNTRKDEIDPQRVPLRLAVERAVFELREALEQIDGRLRTHFGRTFIESLYPALSRRNTRLADDDGAPIDEDGSGTPVNA